MKKLLFAAAGASMLLSAAAFAQGVPAGTQEPVYGSVWAAQKLASEAHAAPAYAAGNTRAPADASVAASGSGSAQSPKL